jgi:N-methylhydantoinase A/oxoprolinase/acetone carboxylase beta subunit
VRGRLSAAPGEDATLQWTAALRYRGQGFEVEIPLSGEPTTPALAEAFHRAHERDYGFVLPDSPVEWVELRVAWEVPAPSWAFDGMAGSEASSASVGVRESVAGEMVQGEARLLARADLSAGDQGVGPAVVVEPDATTWVPSGWAWSVTDGGHLRLAREGDARV